MTKITTWGKSNKVIKIDYSYSEEKTEHFTWTLFFIELFKNPKNALLVNPYTRTCILHTYICINNFKDLVKEYRDIQSYRKIISNCISAKKIIINIQHGGLGDWLVFSTLPQALSEIYGIETYISQESISRLRNTETYNICFKDNKYIKGIINSTENPSIVYNFRPFQSEKSLFNLFTDLHGKDLITQIFNQFKIKGKKSIPHISYTPKKIEGFENTVIVDKNFISGKKLGWYYNPNTFEIQTLLYNSENTLIHNINPNDQDIYTYCDMIYSCKHFITTLSGGAALAAAFDKPFTVILPENISGGSVDQFVFTQSKGRYIK